MAVRPRCTAFVLGGGGHLGAHEVGMLRALFERGVVPDLVVGTSIGAINGAMVAGEPSSRTVERLTELWASIADRDILGGSLFSSVRQLARSGTHVYSNRSLRALLREALPVPAIEDLAVPFQCVAASIERSTAVYFDRGPLLEAVLASSAVPGLLPPVEIDGEHFLDGGLVDSIPLGRAVELGATEVYVLQVGRVEQPLTAPRKPWEVAMVAFEIARRHRFVRDLDAVPDEVTVHVLPTGEQLRYNDPSQLRYRSFGRTVSRIDRSYLAATAYLDRPDNERRP